ncbi:MAG: murein biosynthesis integral membrane protein MurJ [Aminipila sp.]
MGNKVQRSAAQTAALMAALTLISKLFGFIREMILAAFFGTNYVVDAYVMSYTILTTLFGGIIISISTAYIPLFSQITEKKSKEEGNKFTSSIIGLLVLVTIVISLIGIIFSNQIVAIFAWGFKGETASLTRFFVKVLFSYIIFSSIAGILESYLQYKGVFIPQIISGYCISICMGIGIIISAYTTCYYLAFGTLVGHLLRCLVVGYFANKNGYKQYVKIKVEKNLREIFKLALPVFIGSYITYINIFVDKTLASSLVEGSIAALNYASLLNVMIISVTITILSTIVYPKLSQANALNQQVRFNELVSNGFNIVVIIGWPCSLGAMLYSRQAIQIIYERGAFNEVATSMTSSAFMYYAAGMMFVAANEYIVRVYYSMKDMKTPMIFGSISVVVNIVFNLILINYMAHNGLALGTTISAVINFILLILGLKRKYTEICIVPSKEKLFKIIIAGTLAVMGSYISYSCIVNYMAQMIVARIIQLGLAVLIAGCLYLILLAAFKIEEVKLIKQIFKVR